MKYLSNVIYPTRWQKPRDQRAAISALDLLAPHSVDPFSPLAGRIAADRQTFVSGSEIARGLTNMAALAYLFE